MSTPAPEPESTPIPLPAAIPGVSPDDFDPEAVARVRFAVAIRTLTPRIRVTWALLGLNVIAFLACVTVGKMAFLSPDGGSALECGASVAPWTVNGQWWRLFTSMFIHFGAFHIFMNMAVLASGGPLVERLFGPAAFLVIYLASGLAGALASVVATPYSPCAGASGAVFGIYGALVGYLLVRRHVIPASILEGLKKSAGTFIGINLLYSLQPGISMAAHVGGLVGGFLCGLALATDLTVEAAAGRVLRAAIVGILAAASLGAVGAGIAGKYPDVDADVERATQVEHDAVNAFNALQAKRRGDEVTDAQFADGIERDVFAPWHAERERLEADGAKLAAMPGDKELASKILSRWIEYMKTREESWSLYAAAIREDDEAKLDLAGKRSKEALDVFKKDGAE